MLNESSVPNARGLEAFNNLIGLHTLMMDEGEWGFPTSNAASPSPQSLLGGDFAPTESRASLHCTRSQPIGTRFTSRGGARRAGGPQALHSHESMTVLSVRVSTGFSPVQRLSALAHPRQNLFAITLLV